MPAGVATVADHRTSALFDLPGAVEVVRRCLSQIPEDDRPALYERLEALELVLPFDNVGLVDHVVQRAPHGPVRDCLAQLAARHIPTRRIDSPGPAPQPLRMPPRRYRELRALCCPVDAWASTGLRWLSADPDTFYGINTNPFTHVPVALNWRHHRGRPIGLSREWRLDDDGALCGTFWIPNDRAAQTAAVLADARAVAPSVGVRFESVWDHIDPDEWNPHDGAAIDLCRHVYGVVEEISLTPHPLLPTRVLTVL